MMGLSEKEANELWYYGGGKKYNNLEEYFEDVVALLVYSSWRYSESDARNMAEKSRSMIERCFKNGEDVSMCAADVGFVAG